MSEQTAEQIAQGIVTLLSGSTFSSNADFERLALHHITAAIKQAEERGAGRASREWLDKASGASAAKVADVIMEFQKP